MKGYGRITLSTLLRESIELLGSSSWVRMWRVPQLRNPGQPQRSPAFPSSQRSPIMALTRLRAIAAHLTHAPHSARAASTTVVHNDNAGCCSQPAASSTYTPRGTYGSFAGFKRVYMTGPRQSSIAIVSIYDIFGCAAPSID